MPFDLDKFNLQMFLHGAGNTYSVERARRGAAKFFRERQAPLELSAKDLQALADLLDPDKLWPGKAKKTKLDLPDVVIAELWAATWRALGGRHGCAAEADRWMCGSGVGKRRLDRIKAEHREKIERLKGK